MMRRLKRLRASDEDLLDTYIKQVRSILELAAPVWHPALTTYDRNQIERVQKSCHLPWKILQKLQAYIDTLEERRELLCLKFALKASTHPIFKDWFKDFKMSRPRECNIGDNARYVQPYTRTGRFENSPIPYMTKLLNKHYG